MSYAYNLWLVLVFCFFKKKSKNMKVDFIIILLSCQKSELRVINRINIVNGYKIRRFLVYSVFVYCVEHFQYVFYGGFL